MISLRSKLKKLEEYYSKQEMLERENEVKECNDRKIDQSLSWKELELRAVHAERD